MLQFFNFGTGRGKRHDLCHAAIPVPCNKNETRPHEIITRKRAVSRTEISSPMLGHYDAGFTSFSMRHVVQPQ